MKLKWLPLTFLLFVVAAVFGILGVVQDNRIFWIIYLITLPAPSAIIAIVFLIDIIKEEKNDR